MSSAAAAYRKPTPTPHPVNPEFQRLSDEMVLRLADHEDDVKAERQKRQ